MLPQGLTFKNIKKKTSLSGLFSFILVYLSNNSVIAN